MGKTYLMRHSNPKLPSKDMYFMGWTDNPLTDEGRENAAKRAEDIRPLGITSIWASDLIRAKETAEIIAGVLDIGKVGIDPRFRELYFGSWEGRTYRDVAEKTPEDYYGRLKDLNNFHIPGGGETYPEVWARFSAAKKIAEDADPDGVRLIVTHANCVRAFFLQDGRIRNDDVYRVSLPPCGLFDETTQPIFLSESMAVIKPLPKE